MKPLLPNNFTELLTRIDNAIDGELISVTMNNPKNFTLELSVQDKHRGYDWINMAFEIDGIIDARLADDNAFSLIDMSEGISIIEADGTIGLCIGKYSTLSALKDAKLFLLGQSIKYEERAFKSVL